MSHAGRTIGERIVSVKVTSLEVSKSHACIFPMPCLMIVVGVRKRCTVIIDDNLVSLPVTLARRVDYSPRAFEHRNEKRYHDALSKEVLASAKEVRALPFPLVLLLGIITSVARPYTKVAVVETIGSRVGTRVVAYPGDRSNDGVRPQAGATLLDRELSHRYELLYWVSVGGDAQSPAILRKGQYSPHLGIDLLYKLRRERLSEKRFVSFDFYDFVSLVVFDRFHFLAVVAGIAVILIRRKVIAQSDFGFFVRLGIKREGGGDSCYE